jgi:hypothetical protein
MVPLPTEAVFEFSRAEWDFSGSETSEKYRGENSCA